MSRIHVHVNGGGIARRSGRAAGSLIATGAALALFAYAALIVAAVVLGVLVVVLVVRLAQAASSRRRPVAPGYDAHNDAAARAHRARMAAIRNGR